jgi:hypothetical protein
MKYQKVKFKQDCNQMICNRKSYTFTGPDTPLGFQEVDAPRTGRVHSPTRHPGYSFLLKAESTKGP